MARAPRWVDEVSRPPDADARLGTSEKLRRVTLLCVTSMVFQGYDAMAIRQRVLSIAKGVIEEVGEDEYEVETHMAVVQRTVEELLAKLLDEQDDAFDSLAPSG